jgi:hypothetical protein
MPDNQGPVELVFEVKEALSRIKQVEAEYKTALQQMVAATRAGVDQESAEYAQLRARVKETGAAFLAAGEEGRAAMQRLAQATGVETAETKELAGRIAIARAELDRFHTEGQEGSAGLVKSFGGIRTAIAAIATSLVAIKIKDFFRESVEEAASAADAYAEIERLIKSTGGAAHRTAEQLGEAASKLSEISVYDDDEILAKTTATLLRFGSLSGQTFDRANRDAVDLAATLKTDLASAADLLGKALLTPGEALRGLKTAGVDFTESETKSIQSMVEHGRVAQAQNIILGRLEKAVAGAAATYKETLGGALQSVQRDFDDVQEAFGRGLGKELQTEAEGVATSLRGIAPAAEDAGRGVATLLKGLGQLAALLPLLRAGFAVMWESIVRGAAGAAEGVLVVASFLNDLAIKAADVPLLGRLFEGTKADSERFGKTIQDLRDGVVADLQAMGDELQAVATEQWQRGVELIVGGADTVAGAAKKTGDSLVDVGARGAEALDPLPEKAKKAGKSLEDDLAAGADKAKQSFEGMAEAARAALEQEGAGLFGAKPSDVSSLGDQEKKLQDTVAALKEKQAAGSLTAEEMARLFEAEDELKDVQRDLANASREVGDALENMAGSTEVARSEAEVAADVTRRYAEVGKEVPGAFGPAALSLGEFAEQTRHARGEMESGEVVAQKLEDALVGMGGAAHELGEQSESAKAAIAGLAERQGVAAAAAVESAAGMQQAARATEELKEKDPAGYARIWADEMDRVKAVFAWLNGAEGIDLTTMKCRDLVECLREAAAADGG